MSGALDSASSATVALSDLIDAELLRVGAILVPADSVEGESLVVATVLPDGKIAYEDEIYGSPSGAGAAATNAACNGWTYWAADTPDGRFTLATLRERYKDRQAGGD